MWTSRQMKILIFAMVLGGTSSAKLFDQNKCWPPGKSCLIFEDNFDYLDGGVWDHELSLWGGGNNEFQGYVKDPSISFTKNGKLFIKPKLLADVKGEGFLYSGTWNVCDSRKKDNCQRTGSATHILQPVMSARLQTLQKFSFKYGQVEVRAKMPKGNWLWPAIWMLPEKSVYGSWPRSGEMDIVESRGNSYYGNIGNKYASTTLHWGPSANENRYTKTTSNYATPHGSSFADGFHTWKFEWNSNSIRSFVDGKPVFFVSPDKSFWNFGHFGGGLRNPWAYGGKMAPFDQSFYLIINLAVGGTNGYFPDGIDHGKPWSNTSPNAYLDFWKGRNSWLPTWKDNNGKISDDAALQIDYIKVFKL